MLTQRQKRKANWQCYHSTHTSTVTTDKGLSVKYNVKYSF